MNRVFIDSSILVEYLKDNPEAVEIFEKIENLQVILFINPVVFSEVSYLFLKYPSLRQKKSDLKKLFELLNSFGMLELAKEAVVLAQDFMASYDLFPNDALILATCKFFGINYLISLDGDFRKGCKDEGIFLLSSTKEVARHLK
jgi:hypothetical protein